jgi:hypothetical protein
MPAYGPEHQKSNNKESCKSKKMSRVFKKIHPGQFPETAEGRGPEKPSHVIQIILTGQDLRLRDTTVCESNHDSV